MKFNLSLPLILALLASCSGGSGDLARNGLKGSVKEVREFQCDPTYENELWVASSTCANGFRVVEYDAEGNYLRSLTLSDRGDTLAMTTAKRENGEMVEEIYYSREYMTPKHSRLVPVSRTIMDRVSDNQVNFEIWQKDQLRFEGATYFDSKGRVDRQVQVVNNREVMVHNVYEKNFLVEIYQVEMDGSRSGTQQYEYGEFDEKGNWTLRLVFSGEEKITPELAITRVLEYY
ncbi:MAG: hypothetical protein KAR16_07265 [Bacteroidales bacterium]|nr:hypothetical protein [Bacteroidales bacterium]